MSRRFLTRAATYSGGFLLFIVVWWGGSLLVGSRVLPSPGMVARYLGDTSVLTAFARQVAITTARGLLGFSVAWIVAVPVGWLMGRRETAEQIGFFPLFMLQSAPPLFWITPLVLWLGTKGMVAPAVAFFSSLPLLTVHTMMAIRHIPAFEYDVFAVYAPRPLVIARELYLPTLLPALKGNIHLGLLVAIKAAMLAEWFAAQDGFGKTIRVHYQFFAMTEFIGWAFLFLVVVGGISFALRAIVDRVLPVQRPTALPSTRRAVRRRDQADASATDRGNPVGSSQVTVAATNTERDIDRPTLSVEGLTFGYGRRPLFNNVSFALRPDRPLVLYGTSGCGKTSLLKVLAGISKPWAGTVDAKGSVGMVFQQDALLDHRDAIGNVLLPAMPHYSQEDISRARECLGVWGMAESAAMFPPHLSGGMKKRVAMARAWFLNPATLLLDEPFVNLDREAREALWAMLFDRLRDGGPAALIVTHYPEEVRSFSCDVVPWGELVGADDPPRR